MDSVTYIRKRPWRPRSAWLGDRIGARRRGFRQDELCPAADTLQAGVDLVMTGVNDEAAEDDIVLAVTVSQQATQSAVAPRVDVSGLLAIASIAPKAVSLSREDGVPPNLGWHAHGEQGDEESLLTRHSA